MRRRWRWLGLGIAALGLALACGIAWALSERSLRAELDLARRDFAARHFALARSRLVALAARWPERAEVQYELGRVEEARGELDAALAAWSRVPIRSPLGLPAALARGRLAMALGRFADAETSFRIAARDPSPAGRAARHALPLLLAQQGRIDEALAWIETLWDELASGRTDDRLALLHDHISLEFESIPVEGNIAVLDRLSGAADDDRIWLSRANLALRSGRFDEAQHWLDACLKKRPDDPVVWRARLDWAVAADRSDVLAEAMAHLPADALSGRRLSALRTWLAAHRGDPHGECAALEQQLEVDPANPAALERLSDLANLLGDAGRRSALRRRKAELDRARERYSALFTANHLTADAAEMASLAEQLGRDFEARAFRSLSASGGPRREPHRPAHRVEPGTLAALLAGELVAPRREGSRAADRAPGIVPQFEDRAEPSGLASFHLDTGATAVHQLPETMGGGVGLLDYDGDGWLDVYGVQAGPFPGGPFTGDRLFRNRGDGTFEDVTASSGIAALPRGYGHGVAVGDYDNDGDPDLFVTRWRSYALYRNRGDGTFEDATNGAGLDGDRDWPTSAAFADLDNDGDLDLYVCHYGVWDPAHPRLCMDPNKTRYISCHPRDVEPTPDRVFRNDGGRFTDVSREAGIVDREGRGLGVVAADLDDDGRVDLYVANDTSANLLFHNLGGFRFEEIGASAGAAANANGGFQAGMGVACGDLDGDGRPDLAVTNFYDESTTFYQNLGGGLFADRTVAISLAAASRYRLGFGIALFDANNDGRLDMLTANGHVNDMRPTFPYAMPAQLFLGDSTGRLLDVSDRAGPPLREPHHGRGLAAGDIDNDGKVDAVMVSQDEPLVYVHNATAEGGHFVTLRLAGTASNRDGVGARITLTSGGRRQAAQRVGGGSFCSASDPRLHFGLGIANMIDSIELRWPSGRVDRYERLAADTGYLLREGNPKADRLAGYPKRPTP